MVPNLRSSFVAAGQTTMTTRIAQPCWIRFQALAPVGFTALFAIALEIPLSSDTRFCMTFSNGGGKRSWNIIHRHKLFFTNLELSTSIHAIQNTMKCTNSVHRFFLVNFSDSYSQRGVLFYLSLITVVCSDYTLAKSVRRM